MPLIASISGIRGTIGGTAGNNLTPIDIVRFSAAYGSWLHATFTGLSSIKVIVGRDARPSGPEVSSLVMQTLRMLGIHVYDTDLTTTPTLAMAVLQHQMQGGIMISASHNPAHWNALKLMNSNGEFLTPSQAAWVLEIYEKQEFEFAAFENFGSYTRLTETLADHIEAILKLPLVNSEAIRNCQFRIAIDAINSSGSIALPALLTALGITTIHTINPEPHGFFAHNPEPLAENLTELCQFVQEHEFDIGLAVDPDVDRLALVSEDGSYFGEENTLIAVSDYILQHTPGPTVSNLSSSRGLKDITTAYDCSYFAAPVGEAHVIQLMKSVGAVIGGEGNGGIIYPPLHYGRDALVGVALFLSLLATQADRKLSRLKSKYPRYSMAKNKTDIPASLSVSELLISVAHKYAQYPQNAADGLKIDFPESWVHIRASNTEPILRIYAEAATQHEAQALANHFIEVIHKLTQNTNTHENISG